MRHANSIAGLGLLALIGCAATPSSDLPTHLDGRFDSQGVQHIEVVAGSYWFRPSHIRVKANTPVELSVHKQGGLVPHSFVLQAPEAGMAVDIPLSNQPRAARFIPTRAGAYPFYCDKSGVFGNHRGKGMQGVLEVVDR